MKHEVKIGQTDYTVLVFIPDSASTDGSGKTGLVAANLTVSGVRVETDNDVTVTDYTASLNNLAALTTAHTDWGLLEVSSALAPGLYRLDIADAIFATGAWSAVVYVMVTTSAAAASPMEFVLVPESPVTGVNISMLHGTALATPATAGVIDANAKNWNNLTTVALPLIPTVAGRTLDVSAGGEAGVDWANVGTPGSTVGLSATTVGVLTTYTGNTVQTGDSYARIGATGSGLTSLASQASVDTVDNFLDTEIAAILALLDDARGEPGQGAPPVNPDAMTKIDYLYKFLRNKIEQSATEMKVYADDAATVDHKSAVSDDGTTYTRGEIATGP
jgi:hypothetical protein